MALIKYRALQSSVKDGVAYLPERAIPLSSSVDELGLPVVVFIMLYPDWVEEFPDEARREEEERKKVEDQKIGGVNG